MEIIYPLLALAASFGAALCVYLAAPRQQWLARPWPAAPGRAAGALLACLALALWMQVEQAETAIFTLLTLAMVGFIALPCLAALRRLRKGGVR